MTEQMPKSLTINALAEVTGIDRRTLKRRLGDAGLSGGPWDLAALLRALLAGPMADGTLADAIRRRAIAKATTAELEANKASGMYLLAADVERTWASGILAFRSRLLQLPARVAARFPYCKDEASVAQLLETELFDAMRELSRGEVDSAQNGEAVHDQAR